VEVFGNSGSSGREKRFPSSGRFGGCRHDRTARASPHLRRIKHQICDQLENFDLVKPGLFCANDEVKYMKSKCIISSLRGFILQALIKIVKAY
jgi:hypothetical protein